MGSKKLQPCVLGEDQATHSRRHATPPAHTSTARAHPRPRPYAHHAHHAHHSSPPLRPLQDILDQQEARREEQYRLLREKGQKAQKTYESNAGAVDKAREAKEEENRVRWHAQFERETKAKDEARKAHRKKMERECIDGCMLQVGGVTVRRGVASASRAERGYSSTGCRSPL